MMTRSNAVVDSLDSTTPFASQETVQYNRMIGMTGYPFVSNAGGNNFLEDYWNQGVVLEIVAKILSAFPSQFQARGQIFALDDVSNILRVWGEYPLADRIAYFASDEDLEEGDIPVTLESACGFLAFFGAVKSDGRISLTCSPEGWLCAVWRFSDERRASLWFLDTGRVMFSATDAAGNFIEIDGGSEVASSRKVMAKLVETGLFTWNLDRLSSKNFHTTTMLPGIAASGIWPKMEPQWMERFYSRMMLERITSPQTGLSASIPQTGDSRLTASFDPYGPKVSMFATTHPSPF